MKCNLDTIRFSARLQWGTSGNEIDQIIRRQRDQGIALIDLTGSNPTNRDFDYKNTSILSSLNHPDVLNYRPDPAGLESARAAIVDYYWDHHIRLSTDQLILTSCTSEAYSHLFRLFADPGNHILIPRPSYPLFDYLIRLDCLEIRRYDLNYRDRWRINLDSLAAAITPETRAVVIINPNNPTGSYVDDSERVQLRDLCIKHGLPLIVDEVFLDYDLETDAVQRSSFAGETEILTLTLSGLSKVAGLPQMKLSWICVSGPESLRNEVISRLELINDMYLTVNTPVQLAAAELLTERASIQGQIESRIRENLSYLRERLGTTAANILNVEGGWYVVIQLPDIRTDEEWALKLLHDYNVLVHPGYFYDFDEEAIIVCSLITRSEDFRRGIDCVRSMLVETEK